MGEPAVSADVPRRRGVRSELGGGAFVAEAFTFPAFWTFGFLVFGDPPDASRALAVGLGALLVAAFAATSAIGNRSGPRSGPLVGRFFQQLATIAGLAFTMSAVTARFWS